MNTGSDEDRKDDANRHPMLVAVDFSPGARAALVWACDMARRLEVPLQILHVVHDPGEAPGYYKKNEDDLVRPIADVAERMMDEFVDEAREDGALKSVIDDAERRCVVGLPVTRIIEVATQIGACMVVMGSQGRTGLSHLLLGSKAQQVVQLSPLPVTIVKASKAVAEADKAVAEADKE